MSHDETLGAHGLDPSGATKCGSLHADGGGGGLGVSFYALPVPFDEACRSVSASRGEPIEADSRHAEWSTTKEETDWRSTRFFQLWSGDQAQVPGLDATGLDATAVPPGTQSIVAVGYSHASVRTTRVRRSFIARLFRRE